jgi:hypothetical protein
VSIPCTRSSQFHSAETKYLVPETSPQPTTTTGEGSGRRTRILAPRVPNRIRCVTQAATSVRVFFASTEGLLILPRALRCVGVAPPRQSCTKHTHQAKRGRRSLLPREGAWIPNSLFSHHGALKPRGGTINRPARALAASSRSALNVTPRPAPRPRHGHTTPSKNRGRAPMADVVGPTRRDLGTTSEPTLEAPPPAYPLRARVTRCANPRIGTRPTRHAPRADAGDYYPSRVSHDHAGQRGSATHKATNPTGTHLYRPTRRWDDTTTTSRRDNYRSGSRRPGARRRDSDESDVDDISTRQTNRGDTVSPRGE